MQVPGQADALLAGGDVLELVGHRQLIDRGADFPRDDLGERHELGGRIAEIAEEHAPRDLAVRNGADATPVPPRCDMSATCSGSPCHSDVASSHPDEPRRWNWTGRSCREKPRRREGVARPDRFLPAGASRSRPLTRLVAEIGTLPFVVGDRAARCIHGSSAASQATTANCAPMIWAAWSSRRWSAVSRLTSPGRRPAGEPFDLVAQSRFVPAQGGEQRRRHREKHDPDDEPARLELRSAERAAHRRARDEE